MQIHKELAETLDLHFAAHEGHLDIRNMVIDLKVDVNIKYHLRRNRNSTCIFKKSSEGCSLSASKGCQYNPDISNETAQTSLHYTVEEEISINWIKEVSG